MLKTQVGFLTIGDAVREERLRDYFSGRACTVEGTTTSPPKKKQYSEKELEEEVEARLARILGAQDKGKKHDKKRRKSTNFPGFLGGQSTFDKAKKHKKRAEVPSSSSSSSHNSSDSSEEDRKGKKQSKKRRHRKGKKKARKSKSRRVDDSSTEETSTDSSDSEDGHFYANKKNFYKANQYDFLEDEQESPEETLEDHGLHEIDDKETRSDHSCDKNEQDLSKGKRTKVPKAPCKDPKNKASSSATQTTNTRQPKFPPTAPISVNSPRESEGLKHVYVDITKDLLDCKSPPPSTIESFMASLRDGTTFHLRSTRYDLAVDCDVKVIDSIADVDASSNAMNLFALWVENVFPEEVVDYVWFVDSLWHSYILQTVSELAMENYFGKVDLSKYTFTFFPIVDRSHWTLMVFFNGHVRRLHGLPFGKSSILFFDSLGQRSIIDYVPRVERVLKHYARFCSKGHMKDELMDPHRFCHIATIETPIQPNGYDCGYYVMTVMLSLILGGLQHKRSQKWLSSKWFNHDDVRRLKADEEVRDIRVAFDKIKESIQFAQQTYKRAADKHRKPLQFKEGD
ncbi:hypothetical protein L7F22_005067 [Adiantum nelumboides]|nr:hypothetical protein [Adiantum nelumboides]